MRLLGRALFLLFAALSATFCGCAAPEELRIKEGDLEVTLAPNAGGRVVGVSYRGSPNLMDSDPAQYRSLQDPASNAWMKRFDDPRGHVFWFAPQKEWWTAQTLFPSKAKRKSPWPPDPYVEFGRSRIVKRTENSVCFRLPGSPISGFEVEKEYTIMQDHLSAKLFLRCTITNRSAEARSVGIWSVTRPHCDTQVGVRGKLLGLNSSEKTVDGLSVHDGWIAFHPAARSSRFKALIEPENGEYSMRRDDVLWLKKWAATDSPAPGHGPAELLYNPAMPDGTPAILEVESHGPYRRLAPGERLTYTEEWSFIQSKLLEIEKR